MATVSVVWNAYLWSTGRHVTWRHVRQALVPGVFFGLNLATFFAGATHNSVANAALIGSLSPFLIVPLGAWLFREYIVPKALVFAIVAFGGAALVLLNAPPAGDASARGNLFGFLAMLLWTGYIVSTRHFRQDMDVATFMATVSPIAALAVLPLAVANEDLMGLSSKGWIYMLILTFLTGVAAHGLNVYAQKTVQIGTIGIAQVMQPALAVVWSFLLLGETLRQPQVGGIAVVMAGLFAFLVLNQRGGRGRVTVEARDAVAPAEAAAGSVRADGRTRTATDPP
jgi:drug/metabolite transporter (DMT)-like permease